MNSLIVSKFFEFLGQVTYKNVYFSNFSYVSADNGDPIISMEGSALSFNSLVLQSELFRDNKNVKNPVFS